MEHPEPTGRNADRAPGCPPEVRATARAPRSRRSRFTSHQAFLRELLLVVVCAIGYTLAAGAAPSRQDVAIAHGQRIFSLEQAMGLDIEFGLNQFLLAHPVLQSLANHFYTMVFFSTAAAALLALWWVNRSRYYVHRTILFIMTAGALVTYWLYPVAPPRLLPGSPFVDTVASAGTFGSLYGTVGGNLVNEYGAMPSMHTGWSIWVAVALCSIATARWQKVLACCLPVVTVLVIMSTANHYFLDAVGGACYYLAAVIIYFVARRLLRRLRNGRSAGDPNGGIVQSSS